LALICWVMNLLKMKEDYKTFLQKKTDSQIIEILYFEKEKYHQEAIIMAEEILKERNLEPSEIEELKMEIEERKLEEAEEEETASSSGCLDVIFSGFLGVLFGSNS